MFYLELYAIIALTFLFASSFVAGFVSARLDRSDLFSSVFWPLTLANIFGQLTKMLLTKFQNRKGNKDESK